MYNFIDDGELFEVQEPVIENNIDLCCLNAVDNLDLEVMNQACVTDSTDDDVFFTYDEVTMTCIRTADRETKFFFNADTMMTGSLYDRMEYCVEETVDRD